MKWTGVRQQIVQLAEQALPFLDAFLTAVTEELPGGCVLVKHEFKFHIQRVASGGVEGGEVVLPIRLDHSILDIVAQNIDGGLDSIKKRWKRYEKTAEL